MDLSIIIVNYNVKEFLHNLLHSLEQATKNISSEIIIVDNASSDGSVEFLREKYSGIHLIENKSNLGFSKANNLGLSQAKGKYLLLLNPDTLVSEETFEVMISFFENNPAAGLAGCKILNPDGTLQLACRRSFPGPWISFTKVTGLSSIFPKNKIFAQYNLTYLDENSTYEVDAISGSFMMLRRSVYEKIGGLDETFFMYGEDLDWCYRVQSAGYKVYYVHSTRIIHYKGESTKRSNIDETRIFYDAMRLFVQKHFAHSFLVVFILRFAISLRELAAFLGKWKLAFFAIIMDFLFFNLSLKCAESIYPMFRTWRGFPGFAFIIVYSIPASLHLIVSLLLNVYKKDSFPIGRVFSAILVSFFVLSSTTYFFKDFAYSRGVLLLTYCILFVVLTTWRGIAKLVFGHSHTGLNKLKTKIAIVGTTEIALRIAEKLQQQTTPLQQVVGLIGMNRKDIGKTLMGFEVIGSSEFLDKVVKEHQINEVIFSSGDIPYAEMMSMVARCNKEQVEFKVAGSELDFIVGKNQVSLLNDIPLIEVSYNITQFSNKFLKRTFDIIISFLLLLFSPLLITAGGSGLKLFIKKLPSVLSGSCSLVGPQRSEGNEKFFLGKPGLTGFWYIEPYRMENSNKLDIFYAKNQNIWLDLDILGKTISYMLNRK